MILFGKPVADKIFEELQSKPKPAGKFVAIQIGANPVSSFYVEKKRKIAQMLNVDFELVNISENSASNLTEKIAMLNSDPSVKSIMVQIPLPEGFDREQIAAKIVNEKDVDGFSYIIGKEDSIYFPPTVLAIDELLNFYNISKEDKKILIVGEGFLVGRPLHHFWQTKKLDSEILKKEDSNYFEKLKSADIVVLATGAGLKLSDDNFKEHAVVIDASTVSENGAIKGDAQINDPSMVSIAPVPGGVGPVTIAMLFKNFFN
jgi:methylenetetrahydrofolate dehydrogenase (NADP+)/methenyltetrahydrofolate cyclohydrolase